MNKGIYKIENLINGKIYIGQTLCLTTRFKSHLSLLRKNRHRNSHLQAAFNKYGELNFVFNVVEKTELLDEKEIYWIDYYGGVESELNYNKSTGGKGGGKRSIETRQKISENQKGRTLPNSHRQNISIGNIGKKHTEEHKAYMSNLYKNRPLLESTKQKISDTKKGKKLTIEQKEKQKGKGSKSVMQLDENGNIINIFNSAKEAGELLGFWKSDITQCCLGNRKTVKGFTWKYK